jgi:integrase
MATVGIKVFKHHKKADGTYNVKIRVSHKGGNHYIDTTHFVTGKQLTAKFKVKDTFIIDLLNETLKGYRKAISELEVKIELYNSETLRDFLLGKDKDINFIDFSLVHIDELFKAGRDGSAKTLKTVVLSLIDYFKRPIVLPKEINGTMLAQYEDYLRKPRIITRSDQYLIPRTRTVKALKDTGIHNHMRDLRILFKAAMKKCNKPELGEIKILHNPFETYQIVGAPETKKRNITIQQIINIMKCDVKPGSRPELAKELFTLSFFMCGMNAVDLYELTKDNIVNGRLEYNRSKTESRRKDNAFISIKIVKEAKPLLMKYLEKLCKRYASSENLDHALNEGMRQLCKMLKMPRITFYWARYSFGTIARNKCNLSMDYIGEALNHIDNDHKTTDIYIEKDWSIVDNVQSAVMEFFRKARRLISKKEKQGNVVQVKVVHLFQSIVLNPLNAG